LRRSTAQTDDLRQRGSYKEERECRGRIGLVVFPLEQDVEKFLSDWIDRSFGIGIVE
jgi:hypothetical protein